MKYKKWLTAVAVAVLLGAGTASASLWPGLATTAEKQSGAFRTDDFVSGDSEFRSPYLITNAMNQNYAGNVNAAIAREKDRFQANVKEKDQTKETLGWMSWHEGLIGNFVNNNEGITSIVLIEQTLSAGDAHGDTFAKGLNFDGTGELLTLDKVLPTLTVVDVNKCIELTAEKKHIALLPRHSVNELPTNFYVGKNKVVYAIYQVGDLTERAEGVFSVPIGKI